MTDYCNEAGEFQLLVEGKTDCHATIALWKHHHSNKRFSIITCNNDEKVLMKLNALISSSERPKIIGLILDADDKPAQRRLDQVRDKVGKYGYSIPNSLNPTGTLINGVGPYPKIGIWVMPDNTNTGLIEDFYLKLAPGEIVKYVEEVVKDAEDKGHTDFKDPHRAKALIHTYLSWQDVPGNPIGVAIKALKFDCTKNEATDFVNWLDNLFR